MKDTVASRPICYAPYASMYLDPYGDVRACCQNRWQVLGNIRDHSLRDIWRGAEAERLRRYLDDGDLSLGCELCHVELAMGSSESAYLHQFDDLRGEGGPLEWPKQLELALSIACNLQCVMCNGDLSSAIRIHREKRGALRTVYGRAFFEELEEFLPHLERVTFLGGEPFLGEESLHVMDRLVTLGLKPACHVTTNGTIWNERVQRVVTELPVHVAVSVDGASSHTVESIRIGSDFETTRRNIERFQTVTGTSGGSLSLTFCLMTSNWHELGDVLAWADRLDVDVFVNTVTHPPGLSLHHLGGAALQEIVSRLDAEAETRRAPLARNHAVWEREVERIRSMSLNRPSEVSGGGVRDRAARIAADWADDRGVHVVEVDGAQLLRRISPVDGTILGIDVSSSADQPSATLMEPMTRCFGPIVSSDIRFHGDGLEERRIRFGSPSADTEVMAVLAPTESGGQHWFVAARSWTPVQLNLHR